MVKNWDYVLGKWHETEHFSVKMVDNRDYVLEKRYETEYFLVKLVKNWDCVWNWLSQNCLFVYIKWLQFKKSAFMTGFIWIFIKKRSWNQI